MTVQTNAKQLADAWVRMAKSVEPEMKAATLRATRYMWAVSKLEMRRLIYDKAIPTKEDGKPAWRRTGNLRRSERYRMLSPYIGVVSNDAVYARERHERGNTRYPAPWRDEAIKKSDVGRRKIYQAHVKNLIAAGKLQGVKLI